MTYLWDVSHFRQCSAIPLLSGQHGLFFRNLPDKYMCYFHIYAHICKVFLAKLSFLTSYSGRSGRFLRCVSLSASAKPSPRHCGNKAFFWKLRDINICATFIYINLSVRYYWQHSLFWHPIQTVLADFWDVHQFRKIHTQLFPRHCGKRGLFLKNTPDKYISYFHIYARICKEVLAKFTFLTSNSCRLGRF